MDQVNENERYALLEYVSHLSAKDYEATLNDLITLGFIPKEIGEDPEKVTNPLRGPSYVRRPVGSGRRTRLEHRWRSR